MIQTSTHTCQKVISAAKPLSLNRLPNSFTNLSAGFQPNLRIRFGIKLKIPQLWSTKQYVIKQNYQGAPSMLFIAEVIQQWISQFISVFSNAQLFADTSLFMEEIQNAWAKEYVETLI